jgi:AraC-like DNA-binding protein
MKSGKNMNDTPVISSPDGLPPGRCDVIRHSFDSISARYGINLFFHDVCGLMHMTPELHELFLPYIYHNNIFCNGVKRTDGGMDACIRNKARLVDVCRRKKAPFRSTCHMGLSEYVFPVTAGGLLIAFVEAGLFRDGDIGGIEPSLKDYYDSVAVDEGCVNIAEMAYDVALLCESISGLYLQTLQEHPVVSDDAVSSGYITHATIDFIVGNYMNDLSLAGLAENCHCNPTYLSFVFKEKTGQGINEYIRRIRIEKAKELLDITNHTIGQIAGEVGFSDLTYFCRVFRRECGMSPRAYRGRNDRNA